MDRNGIRKEIAIGERKKAQADKRERTQQSTERSGQARRLGRISRFRELSARNDALVRRAHNLTHLSDALGNDRLTGSPWIKLSEEHGTTSSTAYGDVIPSKRIVRILTDSSKHKFSSDFSGLRLRVAAVPKDEMLNPSEGINSSSTNIRLGERLGGENVVGKKEVIARGEYLASERVFNPIRALRRALYAHRCEAEIEGAEMTLTIFEQAAADPELNPQLAPIIERQGRPESVAA